MGTVVLAVQLLLAAVFATAAVGKFLDVSGSRKAMADFGVPARFAPTLGTLLPFAELAAAVLLVPVPTARWGALLALLLLAGFIAGISVALARGKAPDCHCFGQIHSAPAGPKTLIRNGLLAALASVVVVHGAGTAIDAWVSARSAAELAVVGLGILCAVLAFLVVDFWYQRRTALAELDIARAELDGLPPGLPVGLPAPTFALPDMHGNVKSLVGYVETGVPTMLIFTGPRCSACKAMYPDVARWQNALAGRLNIVVMTGDTHEQNLPLIQEHGLDDVILQENYEVMYEYRVRATPTAIVVAADLTVATLPATGAASIEAITRLALTRNIAPGRSVPAGHFDD
jgi:thiol-disulfide isomerase/thioredoxin/uncharacterized membrane protein YphA (DoxX/SURF4 family)